jgi:dTDP-4-dehydrorhamnose reductase
MCTSPDAGYHELPKPPKTAVIGARGFLGRYLFNAYRYFDPDTIGTHHQKGFKDYHYLDLKKPDIAPLKLKENGYKAAVIAGGITEVTRCEQDKKASLRCNVEGTLGLVRQLSAEGLKPIWFSSDYVFDGEKGRYTEYFPPNPINEYGRQKARVERSLPKICGENFLIFRLSKLFSIEKGSKTLLDEMAQKLARGERIRAAWNQIFCPTLVDDATEAILTLQSTDSSGFFNICAPEVWSRLELANAMATALRVSRSLIDSISLKDLDEKFIRPKRTDMVCEKLMSKISFAFTSVKDAIEAISSLYRY